MQSQSQSYVKSSASSSPPPTSSGWEYGAAARAAPQLAGRMSSVTPTLGYKSLEDDVDEPEVPDEHDDEEVLEFSNANSRARADSVLSSMSERTKAQVL